MAKKSEGQKFSFGSHAFPGACIRGKTTTQKSALLLRAWAFGGLQNLLWCSLGDSVQLN